MDYTKLGSRMSGNVMQDPLQLSDEEKLSLMTGGKTPHYIMQNAPEPDVINSMPLNTQQVEQYAQPAMDRYKQQVLMQLLQQEAPPMYQEPVPATPQQGMPPLPGRKPFVGM